VRTVEGQDDIEIQFESICFHSDTPGALAIGTAVRAACSTTASSHRRSGRDLSAIAA
jgi:lactam utilization protein B